jgi:hypothetical protein
VAPALLLGFEIAMGVLAIRGGDRHSLPH